jgi:hypothetical protein
MAKSFKKFRDELDDEWGDDDNETRRKDWKLQDRRDQRRKKTFEKLSRFEDRDTE